MLFLILLFLLSSSSCQLRSCYGFWSQVSLVREIRLSGPLFIVVIHPSSLLPASSHPTDSFCRLMHRHSIPITNSLSSHSHLTFRHLLQAVHAGHRRLELRCLPVGAEQLSNARGSGSQRETRATVRGIQLLLSSLLFLVH